MWYKWKEKTAVGGHFQNDASNAECLCFYSFKGQLKYKKKRREQKPVDMTGKDYFIYFKAAYLIASQNKELNNSLLLQHPNIVLW